MSDQTDLAGIPMPFRERYAELLEIIDGFCDSHLNDEYKQVCQLLAGDLCIKDSPILKGKTQSWAAAIIWTIGRINFLSDKSFEPHMTQAEFAKVIGVSSGTISAKTTEIWNGLDLSPMEPDYTIASLADANPMAWMFEVNGFIVDFRTAPRELQQSAFEQGLIPYIPADSADY